MSGIVNYEVIQPPTGGEVERYAAKAVLERTVLDLAIIATEQQVPPAQEEIVTVHVRRTLHSRDGSLTISGFTEPDRRHIIIRAPKDPNEKAMLSIVGKS